MNSWHILPWVAGSAGVILYALAWLLERPRKPTLLPPPSRHCQRRGPEAVTR